MNANIERKLHLESNNRIPSGNVPTEHENKLMSCEEPSISNAYAGDKLHSIPTANRLLVDGSKSDCKYETFLENEGKEWPQVVSDNEVSGKSSGTGEKCYEKSNEKCTDDERKFEKGLDENILMENGYAIETFSDEIPERNSKQDEKFDDEFSKEIAGVYKEFNDKTPDKHTEINKKFETVSDEKLSKETESTINEDERKLSKKNINNETRLGRTSQDELLKKFGSTVEESSDEICEKQLAIIKKLDRTVCEGLSKDSSGTTSQKLSNKQTYDEKKLKMTCDEKFPKEADKIAIHSSEKYLEKYTDDEREPQGCGMMNFDDESIEVNGATVIVCGVNPSRPRLISAAESPEKVADIFDVVGSDGLWQRFMFSWKFCFAIPTAFHYLVMTFFAPDIDFWCEKPDYANGTLSEWTVPELISDNQCYRYKDIAKPFLIENLTLATNDIVTCDSWKYDTSFYTSTVISQWDLVCGREWLVSFSLSVFNIGTMISSFVVGHLADKLGRKRVIVACLTIAVFSAILCSFSLSYTMFVVTRFLTAFGLSGVYNVSYVLLLEITGPKERSFYGVAMHLGWCIGFITLPGVSWLLRDWFWIEIAITAPCILLLLTCWILTESPRWLMVKGRIKEAEKILIKSAKINGKKISNLDTKLRKVMDKAQQAYKPSEASKGIIDLLRSPGLWRNTLNIWLIWFVISFIYYGLSYSTNSLAGDPYGNFALSGAVEIPGHILSIFAVHLLGRKLPLATSMIFGGIACMVMCVLPKDPWWLSTATSMIGKCSVTIAADISCICTAEIFPTVVRNAGLGSASFFSRMGAVLAPFVKELGKATHPAVPQIVFGVLGCFSGALAFLLPETKDLNVPETLEEAATRKGPAQKKDIENFHPGS